MIYILVENEKIIKVSVEEIENGILIENNEDLLNNPNKYYFKNGEIRLKPYIMASFNNNQIIFTLSNNNEIISDPISIKILIKKYNEHSNGYIDYLEYNLSFNNGNGYIDVSDYGKGKFLIVSLEDNYFMDSFIFENN